MFNTPDGPAGPVAPRAPGAPGSPLGPRLPRGPRLPLVAVTSAAPGRRCWDRSARRSARLCKTEMSRCPIEPSSLIGCVVQLSPAVASDTAMTQAAAVVVARTTDIARFLFFIQITVSPLAHQRIMSLDGRPATLSEKAGHNRSTKPKPTMGGALGGQISELIESVGSDFHPASPFNKNVALANR